KILRAMKAAGYAVQETDPFHQKPPIVFGSRETSPYVNRMKLLWASMREPILKVFPTPSGRHMDTASYLHEVEELYVTDAYHSLSIEGYRVSEALIERVRSGDWNPDENEEDRKNRNALA